MGAIASQITSLTIVYSTVYSDVDQRKYQSSASLAFVRGIHRGPVNSPHKWPVTRKMFPFDDVIMLCASQCHAICNVLSRNNVPLRDCTSSLAFVCQASQKHISIIHETPAVNIPHQELNGMIPQYHVSTYMFKE